MLYPLGFSIVGVSAAGVVVDTEGGVEAPSRVESSKRSRSGKRLARYEISSSRSDSVLEVEAAEVIVAEETCSVTFVRESAVDLADVFDIELGSDVSLVKTSLKASAGVGTARSSAGVVSLSIDERISPPTRPSTDGITNVSADAAS